MTCFAIGDRRVAALAQVDEMPRELRSCVHEFGLPIVTALVKHGVTDPRHIREVVMECWRGPRQECQRSGAMNALDVLLARGPISAAALKRFLAESSMGIVPLDPTRAMLAASMAEVSGFTVCCTKEEKHRRRLRAALRAAA